MKRRGPGRPPGAKNKPKATGNTLADLTILISRCALDMGQSRSPKKLHALLTALVKAAGDFAK